MKRLSWKAINTWIMFGLLLAPGLYLFGGYIGQLAGSHGEFMYAEPAIEGGINFSVQYRGNTYERYMYNNEALLWYDEGFADGTDSYAYLGFKTSHTEIYYGGPEMYMLNNINTDNDDPPYYGLEWEIPNFQQFNSETNYCFAFFAVTSNWGEIYYVERFGTNNYETWEFAGDENTGEINELAHYRNSGFDSTVLDFYLTQKIYFSESKLFSFDGITLNWTTPRNIQETQPYIEEAPAIEPNAQGNTEFQQGQFFSRNNFLKKWGDSVVSQDETWGFAPFKALIQYLDGNMLHFASNGVQYGLMAYGYMYYALHIVLLDLVFFVASFFPRFIKKIVEKLEGGIE